MEVNAQNMIKAARSHISILEDLDYHDIVLSLKASNIDLCIEAYRLASEEFPYPLHVGITEAGTAFKGLITSSIGLYRLLAMGIGNTVRVSLTADPALEVKAAKEILRECKLIDRIPTLTSCPTCGRTQIDLFPIADAIEDYLHTKRANIHVAVMGCIVNGPGEAREADLGIAGGKGKAVIFKKGEPYRTVNEEDIIPELKKEIDILCEERK